MSRSGGLEEPGRAAPTGGRRVALYLRVSTEEQTIENQRLDLEEWARDRGWQVVDTFEDEATSGSLPLSSRSGGAALLKAARRGRFEFVLVWALDRLSREGLLPALEALERLRDSGVEVLSLREDWTSAPPSMRPLLDAVLLWVAAFERDRIRERIVAGMKRAKSQGREVGRPRLVIDEVALVEGYRTGLSQRALADLLQVPRGTLRRRLDDLRRRGVVD